MVTDKYGVVSFLDKGVVACLDEGVVAGLDKDNKNNFDVDIRNILYEYFEYFLLAHPMK